MSETTFGSTTGGNSLVIQPGCPYRLPCGYCKELYMRCINPDYCDTPEWRYNEVTCEAREEEGEE